MDQQDIDELSTGLKRGDRSALSRSITLVESNRSVDRRYTERLIHQVLPATGGAWRIGVTGIPGVGKSTFIDSFGSMLIERGKRVAVLAVDPSSDRSGGSILGDKTRMERLSVNELAFVRPSPTASTLGGVTKRTRESILLCEAAGYDVVLVETVGVGQSETAVHSMTDMFLLLMLAGAGDELQGIKRGIMEMADIIAINKAEGDDLSRFREAKNDYRNALHLMPPKAGGWTPEVELISGLKGSNLDRLIDLTQVYFDKAKASGALDSQRNSQALQWFRTSLDERIRNEFYDRTGMESRVKAMEEKVLSGHLDAYGAIDTLFDD